MVFIKLTKNIISNIFGLTILVPLFVSSNMVILPVVAQSAKENNIEEAKKLYAQGLTEFKQGKIEQAIAYLTKAAKIYHQVNNSFQEAVTLGNLGIFYRAKSDYTQALNYLHQTLQIMKKIKNLPGEVNSFSQLGLTYRAIGNFQAAKNALEEQLKISKNAKNPQWIADSLANLALIHFDLQDYQTAETMMKEQLRIAREINNPNIEETALSNLGMVYETLGKFEEATNYYQQVLERRKQRNDTTGEGYLQGNLGLLYRARKQHRKAIPALEKYLQTARNTNDLRGQAVALNNLGVTLYELNDFVKAESYLQEGMRIQESVRQGLNDQNKISFLDTQRSTYRVLQLALVAQNKIKAALEISERGRARAFIDLLQKNQGNNVDSLNNLHNYINFEKIKAIAKQQQAWIVEYSLITPSSELFIWVINPQGEVNFRRIGLENVEGKTENLLEKLVIDNLELIVNNITRGDGNQKKLIPKKGDRVFLRKFKNRTKKNAYKVADVDLQNQTAVLCNETWESCQYPQILSFSEIYQVAANADVINGKLQKLYDILIKPITNLLPDDAQKKVIFIPHQELFSVPFPALQNPQGKYLIENHTIVTAPSIQVLDLTHKQRQKTKQNPGSDILVIGNPIMPKISYGQNEPPRSLSNLPNSEKEAKTIANLLNTQALIGSQAPKNTVLNKMKNAKIIHLATHGLLGDYAGDGIPGAIALTEELLTASEIFNLKLPAELVVLSACNTGQGKITGDGVMGLSRSFISAGVPSLVVSLWPVDDEMTSKLMTKFYQEMLQTKDKAQALRQAILTTMQQKPEPYYWAAFTLVGEAE
jgi:CHAT domain-containing protein